MLYKFISEEPFYYYGSKFAEKGNILETKGRDTIINLDTGCKIEGLDEVIGQLVDSCEFYPEDIRSIVSKSGETTATIDNVNHPKHYTWLKDKCGIEVIDIVRHMNFNLGQILKYILRLGHKNDNNFSNYEKILSDLHKAEYYLKMEINRVDKLCKNNGNH